MSKHQHLGNRLGPRIAQVVADAQLHHLQRTADMRRKHAVMSAVEFFRTITNETRGTTGPKYAALARHADMPKYLRDTFAFMAHGSGEWQALLSYGIGTTGIGSGIASILTNDLAPITQDLIARDPNGLIAATGVADLVARGFISPDRAASEAAKQGLNWERMRLLIDAAMRPPDENTVYELLRRRVITHQQAVDYLNRQGYPGDTPELLLALERVLISPPDLADLVVRGHLSEQDASRIAGYSGVSPEDFRLLVAQTGAPPGTQEMLDAYRRGIINKATLEHGIRQGRLRDEWIPMIEALRFAPMSVADTVQAVVQGHISDAEGRKIAETNGLEAAHWPIMIETAGEPASRTEMVELWRRGLATREQVEQAIRESRVRDKYIPQLTLLRRRLPPERTVASMLSHGSLTHNEAVHLLLELGYDQSIANAYIRQGTASRTTHERHLARADILALYIERAISAEATIRALMSLGYTQHDADLVMHLADLRRLKRFRDAAITLIRTLYVGHRITDSELNAALDQETLPHEEKEQLAHIWSLERAANRRTLTEAQVVSAHRAGHITLTDAAERLYRMGYDHTDATILLAAAPPKRRVTGA